MIFGSDLSKNNIVSKNFVKGSGDNMILGHLLCTKTNKWHSKHNQSR